MARRAVPARAVLAVMVVFVCLCVVFQMLGAPVTLLGLLTQDLPLESFSEDFSIPPTTPELATPNRSHFECGESVFRSSSNLLDGSLSSSSRAVIVHILLM